MLLTEFARISGVDLSMGCLKDIGSSHVAERLRASGIEPRCVGIPPRLGVAAFRRVRRHLSSCGPRPRAHPPRLRRPARRPGGALARHTDGLDHPFARAARDAARASKTSMTTVARRANAARVIAVSESARLRLPRPRRRPPGPRRGRAQRHRRPSAAEGRAHACARSSALPRTTSSSRCVSSLRPEKAHDVAVAAVRMLLPAYPLCGSSSSGTARSGPRSSARPARWAIASCSPATGRTSWRCSTRQTYCCTRRARTRFRPR